MLTPQEIQEQKFEKAMFGGYDMNQIDKFLDQILGDYSSLYKENAALKAKMRVLVDKIEEYRAVDEELRKTLYNAQVTARDTVSRAQSEAERIVREARATAAQSVTDLQGEIAAEERRLREAQRASASYAEKIRRAMALGVRQMDEILAHSQAEPEPAPRQEPAAAARPEPAAVRQEPVAVRQEPAAQTRPEPAAPSRPEPLPRPQPEVHTYSQEEGVALELEEEEEEETSRRGKVKSDTARIYGDSPFTPKPRFEFQDMRFGKQYDPDSEEDED